MTIFGAQSITSVMSARQWKNYTKYAEYGLFKYCLVHSSIDFNLKEVPSTGGADVYSLEALLQLPSLKTRMDV